ncbi:MAG: hypothetical protein ACWGQW_15315, partial [bacterium]
MPSKKSRPLGRRRFLEVAGGSIALVRVPVQLANSYEPRTKREILCSIYPAVPARLFQSTGTGCSVDEDVDNFTISNRYLAVVISKNTGLAVGLANRVVNASYKLVDDDAGYRIKPTGAQPPCEWWAVSPQAKKPAARVEQTHESAVLLLNSRVDGIDIELAYVIRNDQFWVERRLSIKKETELGHLDRLVYGRLNVPEGKSRVLELGRFDRPLLVEIGTDGGLFAGVGWWFYQVDTSGRYLNQDMDYECGREFRGEPWYLSVF